MAKAEVKVSMETHQFQLMQYCVDAEYERVKAQIDDLPFPRNPDEDKLYKQLGQRFLELERLKRELV